MQRILLVTAFALCLAIGLARSEEDAATRLAARLDAIGQLAGQFSQSREDSNGEGGVTRTTGTFRLLRPAYFAWDIQTPDSQLVVADGTYLWHYDRDLETVTRRPEAGEQVQTPLQVLGGDDEVLHRQYVISESGRGRFQLEPRGEDPAFKRLTLVFNDNTLSGMEILDNLGQLLLIEFTGLDTQPGLTPGDFSFEPPQGADLFTYDQ